MKARREAGPNRPQTPTKAPNQGLRASDSESAAPSISGEIEGAVAPDKKYKVEVHVWNTSILGGEPGHVSLTLKKIGSDDDENKSIHFGFWPERELRPYDALFDFNPKVKKSLDEEIHHSVSEPAWNPNKQYEISISKQQYKDMKKEITESQNNINTGQIKYTWLVPLKTGIYNMFAYYHGNQNQLRLESCSTSTAKILNKGKIPIEMGYALWGITPSDVGDQLEKLIAQNVITGEVIHQRVKPRNDVPMEDNGGNENTNASRKRLRDPDSLASESELFESPAKKPKNDPSINQQDLNFSIFSKSPSNTATSSAMPEQHNRSEEKSTTTQQTTPTHIMMTNSTNPQE